MRARGPSVCAVLLNKSMAFGNSGNKSTRAQAHVGVQSEPNVEHSAAKAPKSPDTSVEPRCSFQRKEQRHQENRMETKSGTNHRRSNSHLVGGTVSG